MSSNHRSPKSRCPSKHYWTHGMWHTHEADHGTETGFPMCQSMHSQYCRTSHSEICQEFPKTKQEWHFTKMKMIISDMNKAVNAILFWPQMLNAFMGVAEGQNSWSNAMTAKLGYIHTPPYRQTTLKIYEEKYPTLIVFEQVCSMIWYLRLNSDEQTRVCSLI